MFKVLQIVSSLRIVDMYKLHYSVQYSTHMMVCSVLTQDTGQYQLKLILNMVHISVNKKFLNKYFKIIMKVSFD